METNQELDFKETINPEGYEKSFILYNDLGNIYYKKNELERAQKCFEEAIVSFETLYRMLDKSAPENKNFLEFAKQKFLNAKALLIDCSLKLGDKKFNDREFFDALEIYKKVFIYKKDFELYKKIGICLMELDANIAALSVLIEATNINPDSFELFAILGDLYGEKLEKFEKAIENFKKAIELCDDDNNILKSSLYNKLGHYYESLDMYGTIETQIQYMEKAIELNPKNQSAYRNLTIVSPRLNLFDKTFAAFKKVMELGPTFDDLFDYACFNIKMKNFEEGWKYYEYRFQKENNATKYPEIKKQEWKGQNINGKTLLIQCEQGFGDSIAFCRYIEQVKKFTNNIIFRVQDPLYDLMKENLKGVMVEKLTTPIESLKFNYHVPLLSLLHILKASVDNIPLTKGYLKANKEKVNYFKDKFFTNDKLKIGIVWHGALKGNERRNIPLETFYSLAKLKNVQLYALQKTAGTEELEEVPSDISIINFDSEINNFSDTAAIMENLDLVITSDNGVFNLAGALGIKTYLLLNNDAEWRWCLEDKVNIWYDNVEMFKKKSDLESWESLMNTVISEKFNQ